MVHHQSGIYGIASRMAMQIRDVAADRFPEDQFHTDITMFEDGDFSVMATHGKHPKADRVSNNEHHFIRYDHFDRVVREGVKVFPDDSVPYGSYDIKGYEEITSQFDLPP